MKLSAVATLEWRITRYLAVESSVNKRPACHAEGRGIPFATKPLALLLYKDRFRESD